MLKTVRMMQLSLVVLARDERAVLRELGQMGVLQLMRPQVGPDTGPLGLCDRSSERGRCDRLLARVEELRRSLEFSTRLESTQPVGTTLQEAEADLTAMEHQLSDLLKRRDHFLKRWDELTAVCEQVSPYRGLEIPLDGLDDFSFLHFVTGSLPVEALEELQNRVGENVALLPLPQQNGRQPLIAVTTSRGELALERILQQAGFQRERLPAVKGATAEALFDETDRERQQVTKQLKRVDAELQTWAAETARPLAQIEQVAQVERQMLDAEQQVGRTEAGVLLQGWVPATNREAVEQRLRAVTAGRCVIEATGSEGLPEEQIPVLLHHGRLLRPFEMLVAAFGLPLYHELEPTLFVAISYVLMFGMMFGDVGHGVVLALGGLAALLAGRTAKVRDLGPLLLLGGLSSIIFGAFYGSCFGLTAFKKYALWRDPLEGDLMSLMRGAVAVGIVMISLGLILNIINRFRRGDLIGGILDKFGVVGLLFYWGMLALATRYAAFQSRGLVTFALILFLGVPIVGWVLKGPLEYARRRAGGLTGSGVQVSSLAESLLGVFEAPLIYLANTISFVRLAAYAVSHAALLVAAFMMAAEVKHLSPGGDLLSLLVIVFGNIAAIVLEGIIASVQALRLEYYEFFGKFFSANGKPFKPFRLTNSSGDIDNLKAAAAPSM